MADDTENSVQLDDTMSPEHYDASDLRVLEGLEAVRVRPGMYIGSTGPRGLHHLVYEIVDNSVDEALAGFASHIEVTILPDNGIRVVDNGRGIPVDEVPGEGKSGVEVVLTKLHAGGKFGGGGYAVSGGLHGVGISVVNALSTRINVEVRRQGYSPHLFKGALSTRTKKQVLLLLSGQIQLFLKLLNMILKPYVRVSSRWHS